MQNLKIVLDKDELKVFNSIFSDINNIVTLDKNYKNNGFIKIYNHSQKAAMEFADFRELMVKLSSDLVKEGLASDRKLGAWIQISMNVWMKKDFDKNLKKYHCDVKKSLFSSMEKFIENKDLINSENIKSYDGLKFQILKIFEMIVNLINKIFGKQEEFNKKHGDKNFDELKKLRSEIKESGSFREKAAFNKLIYRKNEEIDSSSKRK